MSYPDSVLAIGPVAYWRFGEASGTVAADVIGLNPGTYVGSPALGATGALSGDSNAAVTLNGTSQYVTVPDSDVLDVGNVVSIAIWVNRSAIGAGNEVLVTKGTNSYLLDLNNSSVRFVKPGAAVMVTSTTQILDTAWHFIVAVHTAANGAKIYIDAVDRSGSVTAVALAANALAVGIGAASAGGTYFAGALDEPAIWNRALSATEVATLYTAGTNGPSAANNAHGTSKAARALLLLWD